MERCVERFLATAGVRVIRTPFLAPNCNGVIPLGERHLRRTLADFVAHYHGERNYQGLDNELIDRPPRQRACGPVRRRQKGR